MWCALTISFNRIYIFLHQIFQLQIITHLQWAPYLSSLVKILGGAKNECSDHGPYCALIIAKSLGAF